MGPWGASSGGCCEEVPSGCCVENGSEARRSVGKLLLILGKRFWCLGPGW